MSISSNLTKLTTDITNAYTSIENKLPKILPEGYTQVEYIESTGTQYIDTGVKGNSEIKIDIIFKITNTRETQFFFGSRQSVSAQAFCFLSTSGINNPWTFRSDFNNSFGLYQTENIRNMTGYPLFHVIKDKNVTTIENNEYINNISYSNFTSNYNIYIFTVNTNNNTSNFSYMKLYSCKMWNSSGNLVRDFIPCYRNSDNVIGMYDLINDVFYTNQGTGTFLKGYDTAIGMDKNTNNLSTAINSIEVIEPQTAEGESLSLTNTKAMPYSDYVVKGKSEQEGEPSPSNPSEIHSVADDVNLLNVPSIYSVTLQDNIDINLNAGTYILSAENIETQSTQNVFLVQLTKSDTTTQSIYVYFNDKKASFTIDTKVTNIKIYSSNNYNDSVGKTTTFTKLMIKKGSSLLPYSPYNQGTVTIKQRGKNLLPFPSNNFPVTSGDNVLTATLNEDGTIQVTGNKTTTGWSTIWFNLPQTVTLEAGTYTTQNNFVLQTNKGNKNGTFTLNETATFNQVYFQQYYAENVNIKVLPMVVKGNELGNYEPYQIPHDYIIQTEPLRSLPNGVKDTIEDDGIHRRVGRVVLDDVIELYEATIFGTQGKFASYQLQNVRSENRNYNFISNKLAYANEQFVKYGAYRNQTVLIVLTTTDDTLENFNSKISGSEVLYELAEEIIEPLTQNQATTMLDIIKTGSYEGTTNIYTDEDVKPTIEVEYYKKG